jgi:hypothetical protein
MWLVDMAAEGAAAGGVGHDGLVLSEWGVGMKGRTGGDTRSRREGWLEAWAASVAETQRLVAPIA